MIFDSKNIRKCNNFNASNSINFYHSFSENEEITIRIQSYHKNNNTTNLNDDTGSYIFEIEKVKTDTFENNNTINKSVEIINCKRYQGQILGLSGGDIESRKSNDYEFYSIKGNGDDYNFKFNFIPKNVRMSIYISSDGNFVYNGNATKNGELISAKFSTTSGKTYDIALQDLNNDTSRVPYQFTIENNSCLTSLETSINSPQISLYPNPFTNQITLDLKEYYQGFTSIKIFDLLGKVIYSSNLVLKNEKLDIDASFMKSGTYILKVESKNQSKAFKINKL